MGGPINGQVTQGVSLTHHGAGVPFALGLGLPQVGGGIACERWERGFLLALDPMASNEKRDVVMGMKTTLFFGSVILLAPRKGPN